METQFEVQFGAMIDELNQTLADQYGGPAPKPMAKALVENKAGAKAGGQVISGSEFMAKAIHAQAQGFISGRQVAEAEQCIAMHKRPPEQIVRAVIDGRAYSPFA